MNHVLLSFLSNSLTVSIVCILFFSLQTLLEKHLSARCLYRIWLLLLLALLIPYRPNIAPSLLSVELPRSFIVNEQQVQCSDTIFVSEAGNTNPSILSSSSNHIPSSLNSSRSNSPSPIALPYISYILFYLWTVAAVIILFSRLYHYIKLHHHVQRYSVMNSDYQLSLCLSSLTKEYHLANVKLMLCPIIDSPMTTGIFHKTIYFPLNNYTKEEQDLLLKHECIHIKRRDSVMKLLLLITLSIHWFNPITYLLAKKIDEFCEITCDQEALKNASSSQRFQYSHLLLNTAQSHIHHQSILYSNFNGGKKTMKHRIEHIIDTKKKHSGILITVFTALLLTSFSMFSSSNVNTAQANDTNRFTNSTSSSVTEKNTKTSKKKSKKKSYTGQDIADTAVDLVGSPYVYGGNAPDTGFDSSGFVQYVFSQHGVDLEHQSSSQYKRCKMISADDLQPGDLVFYGMTNPKGKKVINHVVIYIGNDKVIHASNPRDGVKISNVDYRTPYAYGRIE